MAQNVTLPAEPPGWRAEQALIACLERLRDQMGELREAVSGVNDKAMRTRADTVLLTTEHVIALHLPEPRDGVVRDLEELWGATDEWRIPAVDPDWGEVTESLRRLQYASGWLLRAVHDARHAAEAWRGADPIDRQEVTVATARLPTMLDTAKVDAMLHRLDQVEARLKQVQAETGTAPRFVQQSGLVNLYVDKMRVKIDLARLHLTVGDQVFDLGLLTSAVEAMGELTARFQGAVNAWINRVTIALTEGAKNVGAAVQRIVKGAHALGLAAKRAMDQTRRRYSFEPQMILIPAGSFRMGIPVAESKREEMADWDGNARPLHTVTIPRPFLLGRYPVTRGEYAVFARETNRDWETPSIEQTDRHPAVNVSFEDAETFVAWLSRRTGRRYRLPSEAEWEYACRAGTRTARHWGEKMDRSKANIDRKGTTPVGAYPPNQFGLHDMLGNVWEWTGDPWHENYGGAPEDSSVWETNGESGRRVVRGGSWNDDLLDCRAGRRVGGSTGVRGSVLGFRVARTL